MAIKPITLRKLR